MTSKNRKKQRKKAPIPVHLQVTLTSKLSPNLVGEAQCECCCAYTARCHACSECHRVFRKFPYRAQLFPTLLRFLFELYLMHSYCVICSLHLLLLAVFFFGKWLKTLFKHVPNGKCYNRPCLTLGNFRQGSKVSRLRVVFCISPGFWFPLVPYKMEPFWIA